MGPRSRVVTDATSAEDIHAVAAAIRRLGSILPTDVDRAGAAVVDAGRQSKDVVLQLFGLTLRLTGFVLGWVRGLVLLAAGLAVVDAALFLLPRRDETTFLFGAVLVLLVLLAPAFVLNLVGRRFAAFRDGVVTIGERLPDVLEIPHSLADEVAGVGDQMSEVAGKRLFGRVIGSARALLRIRTVISALMDRHRELIGAGRDVVTFGPADVVFVLWGLGGLVGLALALPVFALWAILG